MRRLTFLCFLGYWFIITGCSTSPTQNKDEGKTPNINQHLNESITKQSTTQSPPPNTSQSSTQSTFSNTSQSSTQSTSPNTSQSSTQSTPPNTSQSSTQSTSPNTSQSSTQSTSPNTSQSSTQRTPPNTSQSSTQITSPNTSQSSTQSTPPNTSKTLTQSTSSHTSQTLTQSTSPHTSQTLTQSTSPITTPSTSKVTTPNTIQSSTQNKDPSTTQMRNTTMGSQVNTTQLSVHSKAAQEQNNAANCTESKDTTSNCTTNVPEMSSVTDSSSVTVTPTNQSAVNQSNSTNSQSASTNVTGVSAESFPTPTFNLRSSSVPEGSNGNVNISDSSAPSSALPSQGSNVSSLSPPTPSTADLTSHTITPSRNTSRNPEETSTTSNAGTLQSTSTNLKIRNPKNRVSEPSQDQMKCVNETDEYITTLSLNENFRCENFTEGESGKRLANLLCEKLRRESNFISFCEVNISPFSRHRKGLKIVDVVVKVSKEEITRTVENLKSELGKMNITSSNTSPDTSSADALKTKKMVALSVTGILLLLIFTFGIIYMCCQYKSKHRKAQPYLNEELQTIDNCCHDNPAFTESHAEMQEKKGKLKSGFLDITEGFGEDTDSWIAPLEKDAPEEDTHL